MSCDLIGSNCREIYVAVHDENTAEVNIVPNIFGTRVYHASEGWGRFWTWFFNFIGLFIGNDLKKRKLHEAMEKTQQAFKEELSAIEANAAAYQQYLQNRANGVEVEEEIYHKTVHSIVNWNQEIAAFASFSRKAQNDKLKELFKQHFQSDVEEASQALYVTEQFEASLQTMQKIIALEGVLESALPLPLIKKLAAEKQLDEKETKKLKSWIKKINKSEELDIKTFHAGLAACIELCASTDEKADLIALEFALHKNNCKIFDRVNQDFKDKRDSLKKGDTICCNGKKLKLGHKVGIKFSELDKRLIFTVEGDSNEVVVVGVNESILGIEQKIVEKEAGGTYLAKFIDVDKKGACARMERLNTPLDTISWVSSSETIDPTDMITARPIANLVEFWIKQQITVSNMDLNNFMFSPDDVLKSAKVNYPREIDYVALEDFIMECAQDNLAVYIYLMTHSKLELEKYRDLYRRTLEDALNGKENNVNVTASSLQIVDSKITSKACDLYKQAKALKETCCGVIYDNYEINDTALLSKMAADQITYFYNRTKCGGVIWETACQDVVNRIVLALLLPFRAEGT